MYHICCDIFRTLKLKCWACGHEKIAKKYMYDFGGETSWKIEQNAG
jgi:hypothetical protein